MTSQHHATPRDWALVIDPCIVELRGRIEALEAAQHAHVNYAPAKPEHQDKLDRLIEQDRSDARKLTLVERVADGIANTGWDTDDYNCEARAAIREVAAWLKENPGPNSAWNAVARDLMDEANR